MFSALMAAHSTGRAQEGTRARERSPIGRGSVEGKEGSRKKERNRKNWHNDITELTGKNVVAAGQAMVDKCKCCKIIHCDRTI